MNNQTLNSSGFHRKTHRNSNNVLILTISTDIERNTRNFYYMKRKN